MSQYHFSRKMKQLRVQHGITQKNLARKLGVSKTAISNYENENSLPSIQKLIAAANVFGVSVEYLLCGTTINA